MSDYQPPVEEMLFILRDVIKIGQLRAAQDGSFDEEMSSAILDEAAKLARNVLAPLNESGDRQGSVLESGGKVKTPDGFSAAYQAYCENGWNGVPFDPEYGGMGLPWALSFAVQEMWQGANMAFGLCPMLTQATVEALHLYGTDEQKALYLEKLVSGQWTGTMNLTENHAGSDLGLIKAKAEKQEDGSYRLSGQKIFITYGDHDMAENIIHMVLARTPGAPEGIKGISMFLVPKFIPDEQGNPGAANDLAAIKLEEKLGIHASPTCVMQFGDQGGATAYLIGQEHQGIKYMFTMMNNARLGVGLQGVAIAERAYQHALAYARERAQGAPLTDKNAGPVPIIEHEDVRRMLLSMKALTTAGRALTYEAALALDRVKEGDEGAQALVDLLTPLVKAWCTDMAVEVASTGIQIHGGMGFIEETGAAQYYRDARILTIYEGTNGIQAMDLAFRKTLMNGGALGKGWIEQARALPGLPVPLSAALDELAQATDHLLQAGSADPRDAASVCVPYLNAFGTIAAGVMMARIAANSNDERHKDHDALAQRMAGTAEFYLRHILPRAGAELQTVRTGAAAVTNFGPDRF